MSKESKGQFGALFAREVPGVDMLPPESVPTNEVEPSSSPAKPLAKSQDPTWMKTGILIRKTTNPKLRQYLLSLGTPNGQPSEDRSHLVDNPV